MAAYELLSDQGLRLDGRKSGELRRIRCKMGVFGQADGSAYIEQVSLSFGQQDIRFIFDFCYIFK